jgi:homogentisate 1,2-dioxygenase
VKSLKYQPGFGNEFITEALPLPSEPKDFVAGLITLAGNGSPALQSGSGIHICTATASMRDRFVHNADGEPQQGQLAIAPELGTPRV